MQNTKKQLLTVIGFFGTAGAIWGGYDLYGSDASYPLTAVGAVSIGILGGLGLTVLSKNWKLILKTIGLGLTGSIIGTLAAGLGIFYLPFIGSLIVYILPEPIIDLNGLKPSLPIMIYWPNFVLAGFFIGLFFALALKTKIWPVVWRGGLGFGLGAIIGPFLGNLLGNLFDSLFISYFFAFSLIGIILGLFLFLGLRKHA